MLVIDQFEEVFTLCEDESERHGFIRLIANEAGRTDNITRIVIIIRADFMVKCGDYPEIADLINVSHPTGYVVKSLCLPDFRAELEEAIAQPAIRQGVNFEPGLIQQIITDVIGRPGSLPLLQYALQELWRVCIENPELPQPYLTWEGYEEIDRVGGALNTQANLLYNSFSTTEQEFTHRLFVEELVQPSEGEIVTRRRTTWERLDAIAQVSESSPDILRGVIRQLADARLVTTDENTVEVAHESLLSEWEILRGWIENDWEKIRLRRRIQSACYDWQDEYQQSDDALLTGALLLTVEEKLDWQSLPEEEYMRRSLERRDREQRNREQEQLERQHLLEQSLQQERKLRRQERKYWQSAALLVCVFLSILPPFREVLLDLRVFVQARITQLPKKAEQPHVAIVQIDQESIDSDSRLAEDANPINRGYLADLITKIAQSGGRVIAIDYVLDQALDNNSLNTKNEEHCLKKSLEKVVEDYKTRLIFAAYLAEEDAEVGINANKIQANNLNWSLQGYIESDPQYVELPREFEQCVKTCPFSYVISLAYRSLKDPTTTNISPAVNSTKNFRQQLIGSIQETDLKDGELYNLRKLPLSTNWLTRIILDFSVPYERVYQVISAKEIMISTKPSDHFSDQVVIIAPGRYKDAGMLQGQGDTSQLPLAMQHWYKNDESSPNVITGGEIHAYALHHLLTGRLVIHIPDAVMVVFAALLGGFTVLQLERLQYSWTRRFRILCSIGLVVVPGVYGLISLYLYTYGSILLPWVLPSLLFWTYVLPSSRESFND